MRRKKLFIVAAAAVIAVAGATPAIAGSKAKSGGDETKAPDCVMWTQSVAFNYLKFGGEDEPGDSSNWLGGLGRDGTAEQRAAAEAAWEKLPMFVFEEDGSTYNWVRVSDEKLCDRIDLKDVPRYKEARAKMMANFARN